MLIDYDLAAVLENKAEQREATSKHWTGTAPFMARELLGTPPRGVEVQHVFPHELESWLYILLHILLGYTDSAPTDDPLKAWVKANWETVFVEKGAFFNHNPTGYIRYTSGVRECVFLLSVRLLERM